MDAYELAFVSDGLGENDRTMECLERAFRERSSLASVRVEQWSDSNPRVNSILRPRVNAKNTYCGSVKTTG